MKLLLLFGMTIENKNQFQFTRKSWLTRLKYIGDLAFLGLFNTRYPYKSSTQSLFSTTDESSIAGGYNRTATATLLSTHTIPEIFHELLAGLIQVKNNKKDSQKFGVLSVKGTTRSYIQHSHLYI